jgi:hypothetical protein
MVLLLNIHPAELKSNFNNARFKINGLAKFENLRKADASILRISGRNFGSFNLLQGNFARFLEHHLLFIVHIHLDGIAGDELT